MVAVTFTGFSVKFTHQLGWVVPLPSKIGLLFRNIRWNKLQVPLPIRVFALPDP